MFTYQSKKMNKIGVFTLFVFSVLIASVSYSGEYYVDATKGNDMNSGMTPKAPWKTVGKVNKSYFKPGDQILFKSGEVWKGQSLKISSDGASDNHIEIGAYGTEAMPVIDGSGLSKAVFLDGRSFITIKNLEIRKGNHSILIAPGTTNGQVNIVNCQIHDSEQNNTISIDSRGNVKIQNCRIYNSAGGGISAYSSVSSDWMDRTGNNVKLLGNTIYSNSKSGFFVAGDNAVVRNNEFYENGGGDSTGHSHNIYISGDNAIVEKNILRDATYGCGLRFLGGNLLVRFNFFYHNRMHSLGMWSDDSVSHSGITISYNVFIQRSYPESPTGRPWAIHADNPWYGGTFSNIRVYNNSVYGENDNANGFSFRKCSKVDIKNNIIDLKNAYLLSLADATSFTADYNMFSAEKENAFYVADQVGTFSQWKKAGFGKHSIQGNPGFNDPGNNDLRLKLDSAAIGAGFKLEAGQKIGLHPDAVFPDSVATTNQNADDGWDMGAYVLDLGPPVKSPQNPRTDAE